MTERDILLALRRRHEDDLFVPHCKDGPTLTQGRDHVIMDAWVMPRSWSRPRFYVYEVKCTKADFNSDKKWPSYLPYCNEFYFACPASVLQPADVPEPAGLVWVYPNKCVVKRKAAFREVDQAKLQDVFRYILICRYGRTTEEVTTTERTKEQYWREWLAAKKDKQVLGMRVSKRMREILDDAKREIRQAQEKTQAAAEGLAVLKAIGVSPSVYISHSAMMREMNAGLSPLPPQQLDALQQASLHLLGVIEHIRARMHAQLKEMQDVSKSLIAERLNTPRVRLEDPQVKRVVERARISFVPSEALKQPVTRVRLEAAVEGKEDTDAT